MSNYAQYTIQIYSTNEHTRTFSFLKLTSPVHAHDEAWTAVATLAAIVVC